MPMNVFICIILQYMVLDTNVSLTSKYRVRPFGLFRHVINSEHMKTLELLKGMDCNLSLLQDLGH